MLGEGQQVVWRCAQDDDYSVWVTVYDDRAEFMPRRSGRDLRVRHGDYGDWPKPFRGWRKPGRLWKRTSIPEAGHRAIRFALDVKARNEETARQLAETKDEVAAFTELSQIMEAL